MIGIIAVAYLATGIVVGFFFGAFKTIVMVDEETREKLDNLHNAKLQMKRAQVEAAFWRLLRRERVIHLHINGRHSVLDIDGSPEVRVCPVDGCTSFTIDDPFLPCAIHGEQMVFSAEKGKAK